MSFKTFFLSFFLLMNNNVREKAPGVRITTLQRPEANTQQQQPCSEEKRVPKSSERFEEC